MCCHSQKISPPGFVPAKARPINSMVINSDPFASSGEVWAALGGNSGTSGFYCNVDRNRAEASDTPWESLKFGCPIGVRGARASWSGCLRQTRQR